MKVRKSQTQNPPWWEIACRKSEFLARHEAGLRQDARHLPRRTNRRKVVWGMWLAAYARGPQLSPQEPSDLRAA